MAVPEFRVKEQWVGNNTLSEFTFDFTIQDLRHLIVIVQNNLGGLVFKDRGDNTSVLSGVLFDSKAGGGTIILRDVLPNGWTLTALQANDAPTQPSEFKDKNSFTLERFELALDYLITAIQRLAYLGQRALKLNDLDDSYDFDPVLPAGIAGQPRATLIVNGAGTGFDYGPTADDILAAQTFADDASASASAAAASANNSEADAVASAASAASSAASALAAATSAGSISGFVHSGPFAAIPPNTNLDLETVDHTVNTEVDYSARVKRGTLVFAIVNFSVFYRAGAWELVMGETRRADLSLPTGVTFTVGVGGAINAAVANDGGNNAIIDLNKIQWPT